MVIGLLQLKLRIPENQSLKGKRQVLLSLKTRIRQRFNVSVSEVEDQDKWQLATLAVVSVGTDREGVNRQLNHVADLAQEEQEAQVMDLNMEFF